MAWISQRRRNQRLDGRREEGVAVGERRVHGACARPETAAEPSAFDDAFLQFVVVEGCFNVRTEEQGVLIHGEPSHGMREFMDDDHAATEQGGQNARHGIGDADETGEDDQQCDGEDACRAKIRQKWH